MRILVTGGAGRVGPAVVERLAARGDDLTVIGRTPGSSVRAGRYVRCDITDFDSLLSAARGMDAVVHLAAIPGPGVASSEETFRINCSGTFNVFEASARAGVRRVVCASSINAVGFNFGVRAFPVPYLPVDEEFPRFTTDPYSFSKQVTERIAAYFWKRDGISGVCLRIPWVAPAQHSEKKEVLDYAAKCRASLEALMALPAAEVRTRIAGWIALRDRARAERLTEKPFDPKHQYAPPDILVTARTDFYTRIDERDAALAVERGLISEYEGSHVLFANDSHNVTGLPSETLARLFFPEAEVRSAALAGTASLVSTEKARRLIGFAPEHSVGRWY